MLYIGILHYTQETLQMSTTILDKLETLNLPENTEVTLSYSDGTDVFVHNDTAVETAIHHTDTIAMVAELLATPKFNITPKYANSTALNSLRSEGLLESYERGSQDFQNYLTSVLEENFYETEIVDYETKSYDYKRGFTTISANFTTTVKDLFDHKPNLFGWSATVQTEVGTLTLD